MGVDRSAVRIDDYDEGVGIRVVVQVGDRRSDGREDAAPSAGSRQMPFARIARAPSSADDSDITASFMIRRGHHPECRCTRPRRAERRRGSPRGPAGPTGARSTPRPAPSGPGRSPRGGPGRGRGSRGSRRRDHLDGWPRLAAILRVGEPVERVVDPAEQPGVDPVVGLFETDQGRWLGQVRERQNGDGQERSVREVGSEDLVPADRGAKGRSPCSALRSLEENPVEFRQPVVKLRTQILESLRRIVTKTIEDDRQVLTVWADLGLRLKLCGAGEGLGVEGVYADRHNGRPSVRVAGELPAMLSGPRNSAPACVTPPDDRSVSDETHRRPEIAGPAAR